MKGLIRFRYFISMGLVIGLLAGCGGGGDKDGDSTSPPASTDISDLFPELNEEVLVNSKPAQTVVTSSDDVVIQTTPSDNSTKTTKQMVVKEEKDGSQITLKSTAVVDKTSINTPLFVDDIFKGMISSFEVEGDNVNLGLKDADKISDAYKSFDLQFRNDHIVTSVNKALAKRTKVGRFDHINANPLQVRAMKKQIVNDEGVTNEEVVLRIDIPKGYYAPAGKNDVSCSILDLECSIVAEGDVNKNLDLEYTTSGSGVTFTTAGSYIEIGLGVYIRAHYDYNYIGDDILDFDYAQSTYFKSKMTVSVSGSLDKDWTKTLNLVGDINLEIVHPYSLAAKTSVIISPAIVIGIEGEIKGAITATSEVSRAGEVRFSFDSVQMSHSITNNIKYTPSNINKDGVSIDIEANGDAYIFPAITMLPSLRFIRVTPPITLVFLRSGLKLNTNINGKIQTGFVVENNSEIQSSLYTEASLTTSLEGLLQGKWYVRISPVDFYSSEDYSDIFSTGKLNILQWKGILLNKPTISIKEHPGDINKRDIEFDIEFDEKNKAEIHYYYSLDGKDVPITGIASHKPVWNWGDMPIEVEKNTKVKVRAVLYNKDISDSLWAWGTSISEQVEDLVSLINKPFVSPGSRSFEDELRITMSQDQGYEIYYQKGSAAAVEYTKPITLTDSVTLTVYARDIVDGNKIYSTETSYKYDKCKENESLDGGVCVEDDEDSPELPPSLESFDVVAFFNDLSDSFDEVFDKYNGMCPSTQPGVEKYLNIELNPGTLHCTYSYTDDTLSGFMTYGTNDPDYSISFGSKGTTHIVIDSDSFQLTADKDKNDEYNAFSNWLGGYDNRIPEYSLSKSTDLDLYTYYTYTDQGISDYFIRYDLSGNLIRACKYNDDGEGYAWCDPEF